MPWISLAAQTALLGYDAVAVISLRLIRLSRCDARALAEAQLMVGEKLEALAELQWRALTGQLGTAPHEVAGATLGHVRGKVSANRRRLSRR